MRTGREEYTEKYEEALKLCQQGVPIPEIAQRLGISYSAAYHWVTGLRKPEKGNIRDFEEFLKEHGPVTAADIRPKFPKHNEIYLTSKRRGVPVFRYEMEKKKIFGEYATWYFLRGQEELLKERVRQLIKDWKMKKVKDVMQKNATNQKTF